MQFNVGVGGIREQLSVEDDLLWKARRKTCRSLTLEVIYPVYSITLAPILEYAGP